MLLLPVALFALVTITFLLVNLIPSNPAVLIAGPSANPTTIHQIDHELGLDRSLWARYWSYVGGAVHGNLGRSIFTGETITNAIATRVTSTIELVVATLLVGGVLGIALGAIAAVFEGRSLERVVRLVISVSQAIPEFLMGIILIFFVFYTLRIAPAPTGQLGLINTPPPNVTGAIFVDSIIAGQFGTAVTALQYMIMPVLSLSFIIAAFFAKTARTAFIDVLQSPSMEFARSAGLRKRTLARYALTQVRTPLITYVGILFPALIGGEAIVEYLFSWGGVGNWAVNSILQFDIPAIQGFVLLLGVATLVTYLVVEVLIVRLDPRLGFGQVSIRK